MPGARANNFTGFTLSVPALRSAHCGVDAPALRASPTERRSRIEWARATVKVTFVAQDSWQESGLGTLRSTRFSARPPRSVTELPFTLRPMLAAAAT